jgi:hypothetical protein
MTRKKWTPEFEDRMRRTTLCGQLDMIDGTAALETTVLQPERASTQQPRRRHLRLVDAVQDELPVEF